MTASESESTEAGLVCAAGGTLNRTARAKTANAAAAFPFLISDMRVLSFLIRRLRYPRSHNKDFPSTPGVSNPMIFPMVGTMSTMLAPQTVEFGMPGPETANGTAESNI